MRPNQFAAAARLRRQSRGGQFVTEGGVKHAAENRYWVKGATGRLMDGETTFVQEARAAATPSAFGCAMIAQQRYTDAEILEALRERGLHKTQKGPSIGRPITRDDLRKWRNLLQQGRYLKYGRPAFRLDEVPERPAEVGRPGGSETLRRGLAQLSESSTEEEARTVIDGLARTRRETSDKTAAELLRMLSTMPAYPRSEVRRTTTTRTRNVSLSRLLKELYRGRCQICRRTFATEDGSPYCETHHINPVGLETARNLLVLCPTCHRKMEYARVTGARSILTRREVTINGKLHAVTVHEAHR